MAVLDTNIIIRYLTQDNDDQSQRALSFLQQVESGDQSVILPEGVLIEIVQVLSSKRLYDIPRTQIRDRLRDILQLPGVKTSQKRLFIEALDSYVAYPFLSFVDALCMAYARRDSDKTIISFDRGFDRLTDVTRKAP